MRTKNPNSRQGMQSLRRGQAKKLDREIEESCRRNGGTGAPIGPPMGHKGCSHRVKADRTGVYGPAAGSCRLCGLVMVEPFRVVRKMYREFEGDANVLRNIWLVKHYSESEK